VDEMIKSIGEAIERAGERQPIRHDVYLSHIKFLNGEMAGLNEASRTVLRVTAELLEEIKKSTEALSKGGLTCQAFLNYLESVSKAATQRYNDSCLKQSSISTLQSWLDTEAKKNKTGPF
jgi:hypothetical protein